MKFSHNSTIGEVYCMFSINFCRLISEISNIPASIGVLLQQQTKGILQSQLFHNNSRVGKFSFEVVHTPNTEKSNVF